MRSLCPSAGGSSCVTISGVRPPSTRFLKSARRASACVSLICAFGTLKETPESFTGAVAPVALALKQERTVTEQIVRLAALAREENDLVGAQFMDWFLKEQREEVASMSALLAVVERAADNLLLAEEHLARHQIGDAGVDPTAPPAAGGAL